MKTFAKKVKNLISSFLFGEVTRRENVNIKITALVTKKNRRFLENVEKLFKLPHAIIGDVYKIDYNFNLDYLDDINKRFDAIISLMARKDVKIEKISYSELNHGKILIQELLNKLNKMDTVKTLY
jgi:hypothetical protein